MNNHNRYLIACLCEGAFEEAIMELLLENDCLIFSREALLEEEILRCRSAKNFQRDYLNKATARKIKVYRILDSFNENFKLTGPYKQRVEVVNIITAPEIEMLIIHAEDKFDDYSKEKLKPSDYVKIHLKIQDVKSGRFVKRYFKDVKKLKSAIKKYHQKTKYKDNTLLELLK